MFIKNERIENMNKLIEQFLFEVLEKLQQDVPGWKERQRWHEHHQKLKVFGQPKSVRHKAIINPQDVPDLKKELSWDEV
jgi:hypothetical protein